MSRSAAQAERTAAARISGVADELGRLPELGRWIARVQGEVVPAHFRRVRAVLVETPPPDDASAVPPTEGEKDGRPTSERSGEHGAGQPVPEPDDAVLDVLADRVGVGRRVVDVDVVSGEEPGRDGVLAELPEEEYRAAYELGRYVADEEADAGTDLLLLGVGRRTREHDLIAATALVSALLGREPVPLVGTDTARGNPTGLDDRTWARRVSGVRDMLRRTRVGSAPAPVDLIRLLGGGRVAMLVGLLQQSVERRTPVVLDGTVGCAAALAADRLDPDARDWWLAAAAPAEPAGRVALEELELSPLLQLGVRLGTGAGALLAVPLLTATVDAVGALVEASGTARAGARPS